MSANPTTTGEYVSLDGERYYRIANSHRMEDFFMSIVGAGDHWMFVSSNGALTAGRQNADNALFPYASDDKVSTGRTDTGSLTLLRAADELWEPFAPSSTVPEGVRRNLYKTPLGNKLVFEELNESLALAFRYRWTFSNRYGFVRSCHLENTGGETRTISLLDGIRNLLPYGVGSEFMMRFSNLANAYKKSELVSTTGLGIYYLSSIPSDRAEPSEGLKATTVWQTGLDADAVLLSAEQVDAFRTGGAPETEAEIRGKAGAYLAGADVDLAPGSSIDWHIVAELAQDHSSVVGLDEWLGNTHDPAAELTADIEASEREFVQILSSSDAMQSGANERLCNRHLSNTVFNVMRGGVPLDDYRVSRDDFSRFVANFNHPACQRHASFLAALPDGGTIAELQQAIAALGDPDLTRLGLEYLPLAFSRRHGDPTRPWNHFSIDLRSEDGRTNLNYQGNWRDIFQNWEALLLSFPEFSTGMICRFVNATTADGYNPYKVTRNGFDWESPNPNDPWANIGYWGDHQIIYLLKLLEWTRAFYPGRIDALLDKPLFTHANVPYRIKGIEQIKADPRDTIEFDFDLEEEINRRCEELGADGKLLPDGGGGIHRVTLVEKLLTLSLAKLSNFIPDGGIWLNTQRPEWNDANNALVGNGLSMVTTCYLHRWFDFLHRWLSDQETESFSVSLEVATFFQTIADALQNPTGSRLERVEALSRAGSDFRAKLYADGLSGETTRVGKAGCLELFERARSYLESTIRNNRRPDGLYHAYNLIDWREDRIEVEHLYEMLEGQVAVLSCGLLGAGEAVQLLDALRASALYRENQDSYLLYPDRQLPRFLAKNNLDAATVESIPLIGQLLERGDTTIVTRDVRGGVHFNGAFRNSADLRKALAAIDESDTDDANRLVEAFEEHFGHRQFTGRSGTFFAYEGLGSIYWHMVSKLGLAVSENVFWAIESGAPDTTVAALAAHHTAIKRGIGAEKSPTEYGAFPSDPYSHTPENAGVKQPGMTGQVKEDILARFAELGVQIDGGRLGFRLDLFDTAELGDGSGELTFYDLAGNLRSVPVPAGGFAFTLFQVPIVYTGGESDRVTVAFQNGEPLVTDGRWIDPETSAQLFARSGTIESIRCQFTALHL